MSRTLTCVYCGMAYPQDTPAWGDKVLTDHIRVCPKHPMRKAEADAALLRGALLGLAGVESEAELKAMAQLIESLPDTAETRPMLKAVRALIATIPAPAGHERREA